MGEVVWEYVNPFFSDDERFGRNNTVFRELRKHGSHALSVCPLRTSKRYLLLSRLTGLAL